MTDQNNITIKIPVNKTVVIVLVVVVGILAILLIINTYRGSEERVITTGTANETGMNGLKHAEELAVEKILEGTEGKDFRILGVEQVDEDFARERISRYESEWLEGRFDEEISGGVNVYFFEIIFEYNFEGATGLQHSEGQQVVSVKQYADGSMSTFSY